MSSQNIPLRYRQISKEEKQCIVSHVLVCGGTGCTSANSPAIIEALEAQIAEKGLTDEVKVVQTGCHGLCALGPIMIVYPEGCFLQRGKG